MKKIFIIIVNLALIYYIWFRVECTIYNQHANEMRSKGFWTAGFEHLTKPYYAINLKTHFKNQDDISYGRKPDGLQYSGLPTVIFGCSYAQGQQLKYNQTFSYKLANILKRPVYNRALSGKSFPLMYFQSENDFFYKDVPPCDTVIYVMINDHYRRMKLSFFHVTNNWMEITYKTENEKLKKEDFSNPVKCFINSMYITKHIKYIWAYNYANNAKNAEKLTDEALTYFIETRKNLESRWNKKVNFIVFMYDYPIKFGNMLPNKLKANNFKVITLRELTQEDIYSEKYLSPITKHPTEEAWDLLTPLIAEKIIP